MSLHTSQSTEEGNDQIIDESFLANDSNSNNNQYQPLSIDDDSKSSPHRNNHHNSHPHHRNNKLFQRNPHHAVLPVLLLEFLSLSITRAVLPSLLLRRYGRQTYVIMGCAECLRGILAFFACPLFGKMSDAVGRKKCLFVTVLGSLMPVCSLAFWRDSSTSSLSSSSSEEAVDLYNEEELILDSESSYSAQFGLSTRIDRIDLFVFLLALSGIFSSTFTLTFAYISDVVQDKNGRVAAYGLALATFGLSFTIGPLLGGYLANVDEGGKGLGGRNWMDELLFGDGDQESSGRMLMDSGAADNSSRLEVVHPLGQHRVFLTSFVLALLDLLYIHFILPESLTMQQYNNYYTQDDDRDTDNPSTVFATESNIPTPSTMGISRRISFSTYWNPFDSLQILTSDPLLSTIGKVTFFYYTALHAVVSTLILYAVRHFHLGPHRLGELMAALGLSTMVSEAVLVRVAIPLLGEKKAMRVGLVSFAMQCILLAVATKPWHLFGCAVLAIPGNLVYPSVTSLVSSSVKPNMVGRALGAVNGVKSLTEGVGPLLFGTLLTLSEKDALPGWPYFIAGCMAVLAFRAGGSLPCGEGQEDEYCRKVGNTNLGYKYNINLREEEEGEDLLGR
ncbi:hypothetical protein ACHAXN_009495 [Cyclotella atomus]